MNIQSPIQGEPFLTFHFNIMRIPCLALIYFDFPIIEKFLNFISLNANRLSTTIIENPSPQTDTLIKPFIENKMASGFIENYFLFEHNISNNAFEVILDKMESEFQSPYVLVTDGDITVESNEWLEEQIMILENCPEVFACAVSLDMSNLPLESFPDAAGWVPEAKDRGLYLEGDAGIHLTLFRTQDLRSFLKSRRENNWKFRDGYIHNYARANGRSWARTKKNKAIHLTWDAYKDLNHPYTAMKLSKSFGEIWNHEHYCEYSHITSKNQNASKQVQS